MWSDLPEEYREYADVVRRFATTKLDRDVVDADERHVFDREAWRAIAGVGIQGLPIPEEFGGAGADTRQQVLALEALGYGCRDDGLLFSLNAHLWATTYPIVRFGTEQQKRRYLPGMAAGTIIGAHGMSEPGSGSDALSLRTTARLEDDHVVLDGSKTFVSNAPVADVFVVFATSDPGKRFGGISAFLVDRDAPGLTVGEPLGKMGLRTSPMGELFFDSCRVPTANVLGRLGGGMPVFFAAMEHERSLILASVLGTMQWRLERCIDYARERQQFGKPIGRFQAVSHRIAEMRVRLETSRLLMYDLAAKMDRGESVTLESAMTKLHLSEAFVASSLDAQQVYGGWGYMSEYEVEREIRDALGSRLYSGTSDIQRNLIARQLGL